MSDLTLTSTTSSEAELRHAVSENWRTPPGGSTDAPDSGERVVPLDKSDFKDYKRIRDEQVAEKKFEGPDFLKDDKQKPHKKSGWERRIDKLTAINSRLERELKEARKPPAEAKAPIDTQASPIQSSQAQPSRTEQSAAPTPNKITATGNAQGSSLNRPENNPAFVEAARAIPGIEKAMADADGIGISPTLHDNLVKSTTAADRPRLVKFLTESPRVLQELDRDPGSASQRIAQIVRDLKGTSQSRPVQNSNADATRTASLLDAHNRRVQATFNSLPDANQLMAAAGRLPIAQKVAEAVIEQDNSDAVVIHLARHPDALAELNRMSPTAAAAKVGRLAAEIEARTREAAAKPKEPKERVRPPDPISTVGSSSSASSVPLDQKPLREYNENSQQARTRLEITPMTKPMTAKEFADGLIVEIEKRKRSQIQTYLSWDTLKELVGDVLDPKPEPERHVPTFVMPFIPREFPKLKVLYPRKMPTAKDLNPSQEWKASEFVIVHNYTEEENFQLDGWWIDRTVQADPTKLDARVEELRAAGVKERQLSDDDRRSDKFVYRRV